MLLEVSAISLSEIAIKQAMGKLHLRKDDVEAGLAALNAGVLPYTSDHAWQLFHLPAHHSNRSIGKSSPRRWPRISRS